VQIVNKRSFERTAMVIRWMTTIDDHFDTVSVFTLPYSESMVNGDVSVVVYMDFI